jgi:hypothetical protein
MNNKIPTGKLCDLRVKVCPCLYDDRFCQLFNESLISDEVATRRRCEECLKMFPNGGTIVPDAN